MLLAILLVLILIAVLIAPWLLGAAAVAAALYGTYLVIAAMIAAALCILIIPFYFFVTVRSKRGNKPKLIPGKRKSCKFCQVEMPVSAKKCENCGQSDS